MAFTFFFRDTHTLEHAARILTPEVAGRSKIRIWDAGCAMGPEPFTFAIIMAEHMGNFSFKNLYITATDIDETDTFGNIIKEGSFPEEDTKRIPPEIRSKYFEAIENNPSHLRLTEKIRSRIQFQKHDLLSLNPVGSAFSLIICKNVLLHFQQHERIQVIKMFYNSLDTGGLFLTEHTQKMPAELSGMFEQIVPDAQLFRKIEAGK